MDIATSILAATDFSELGRGAVEHALELAEKFDAKLHVVSVDTPFGDGSMPAHDRELRWLREQMGELEERLKPSKRLGHAIVRSGEPAATIVAVAKELGVDMIVMGTNPRHGFSWLTTSSVAEGVLQLAEVPVLVISKVALHAQDKAHEPPTD